jgi:hypothetical protein
MRYWFNVNTRAVEDDSNKSPIDRLLGPFDNYAAAEAALEHARENTERWDAEDRAWDEEGLED